MAVDVRIPELGESITEGVIVRWLKQDGDTVRVDEPVLELETDKANVELPASASGRLEIVEREGATVRVGTVVARIAESAEQPAKAATLAARTASSARRAEAAAPAVRASGRSTAAARQTPAVTDNRSSPPADRDASAEPDAGAGEPAAAARREPASTAPSRKREDDAARDDATVAAAAERVEAPAEEEGEEDATADTPLAGEAAQKPGPGTPRDEAAEVERKPMSRLRRRIAERLVEAQHTAAILTTFNEVDLSRLLAARQRHRETFRERHGVDLGLVALFGRACMLALADVPVINARIDGEDVVYQKRVHLGIAVSTPRGLVVPVVRDADLLRLADLARAIDELARLARDAKLTPAHLSGGTFTITNGGVFGSLLSTPILNPPQSGILGMHKIMDRPVAVDGQVVIRPMMYVALSYDHRLVDGEQAVTFLVRIKERLEDPVRMLFDL